MSDLSKEITALLSDPKSMEQFKALANTFLQSNGSGSNGSNNLNSSNNLNGSNGSRPSESNFAANGNENRTAYNGLEINPEVLKMLADALSGNSSENSGTNGAVGNLGLNGGSYNIFGGNYENGRENAAGAASVVSELLSGGGNGGFDLGSMMKIINILKTNVNDDRAQLLMALRPHLSEERRHRVDKAVKILKLVSLVPIFKQQGILNF